MSKRLTRKLMSNITLEQAQEASQLYAVTNTSLSKVEAKMNEELNKVKSKYQDQVTSLQDVLEEPIEILKVFAEEQKTNWGKKKSFELLHCTVGFRTGTPKVDKSKKFTWDAVVELVKKNKTLSKLFIRTKDELNKEAVLAVKDEAILNQLHEEAYVFISQEETFFVQEKKEELVL